MRGSRSVLVLAVILGARVLSAQQLHGLVRDSVTGAPLPGAIVEVLSGSGGALSRSLTSEDGAFTVVGENARRLHVVRIGYRPVDRRLESSADNALVIKMVRLPMLLEPLLVTRNRNCRQRVDEGGALALWEDARAGLLATIIARESRPAQFVLAGYLKRLDRNGREAQSQTVRLDTTNALRSFRAVRAPAEVAALGFASDTEQIGVRTYYGPDADVLLDPEFAATHCFGLASPNRDHPGEAGLAFEPALGRDSLVEVMGTLWLDRTAAALRSMDFEYTDKQSRLRKAGGTIHFLALPNGVSVIDAWSIRYAQPAIAYSLGDGRVVRSTSDAFVEDDGGRLVSGRWDDGFEWRAGLPAVAGRLVDRSTHDPIPNAIVTLNATTYRAISDSLGRFSIPNVLPGPYGMRVTTAKLSTFDIDINDVTILRVSQHMEPLTLQVRSESDAIWDWCGKSLPSGSVALRIKVLGPDGNPPEGHGVDARVEWQVMRENGVAGVDHLNAQTDRQGIIHACGIVPAAGNPHVTLRRDDVVVFERDVRLLPGEPIQEITVRLRAQP